VLYVNNKERDIISSAVRISDKAATKKTVLYVALLTGAAAGRG
jgi:hypothetical protein